MKLRLILLTPLLLISCGGLPDVGPPSRPEHPHPQMERTEWLNLNGYWGFGFNAVEEASPSFRESIRVPFPWQSDAAAVDAAAGAVGWYRRAFVVPSDWASHQTWLHLERISGRATVWINEAEAGAVPNGSGAAEIDVTGLAAAGAESQITVRVEDPMGAVASGIVGTVWLERRPRGHLSDVVLRPIHDGDSWVLEATLTVAGPGGAVDLAIDSTETALVATRTSVVLDEGSGTATVRIPVVDGVAWSPDSPKVYPLTIRVTGIGDDTDVVQTSFGLRTVERAGRQVLVNGRAEYFRGVEYAPDLLTAEDDEVVRQDIERFKAMGFNLLHLGPGGAEPRLRYWADQLGLWVLEDDADVAGPSSLVATDSARPLEIEITEAGSDQGSRPLLVPMGPQDSAGIPQLFRDFTNRVRRLDFAQGYVWSAELPAEFGYAAVVPDMTAADLQSANYVGIAGAASFEVRLGEKLAIAPFVSRFSAGDEPLHLQAWLRGMNDLGGVVEIFSRPRVINVSAGEVIPLDEIEMSVPLARGLSGTVGFELLNDAGERQAANFAPLVARGFDTVRSPRAEQFSPRRLALRVAPADGVELRKTAEGESVEYIYPLAAEEIGAGPTEVEVLAEVAAGASSHDSALVKVLLNGREIGELNLPDGPSGPAAFASQGSDSRYGYLAKLSVDLTAEDIVALRERQSLALEFVPVTGRLVVFGERSGRYVIDPTVIVVTESVPGSAN